MSKKILIIEDDANQLYSLQAKFRVEGFGIIADNGNDQKSIINKIRRLKPDFIILDLALPEIDGFNLLTEIKSKSANEKIPVFIYSDLKDKSSQERCLNLGADLYFIKSDFSLDEFTQKIKKVIFNKYKETN